MKRGIPYKGILLMPGSEAHRLHTEGKMRELEKHMKELDQREKETLVRAEAAELKESAKW